MSRKDRPKDPRPGTGCVGCGEAAGIFPFTMAFQPVIDLELRRIDAYEALVRGVEDEGAGEVLAWVNADNRYAFDQACRVKAIEMASALGIDRQLNINFLPNAVYAPAACIRRTLEAAGRTGFPLNRITFEIVEQEDVAAVAHLTGIIDEYRRHGFKVAMDDFSTGYSGLSRLAELRPDIVKIDRALIDHCDQDKLRLAIIASMVGLCRETGIKLVLEGVERLEESRSCAESEPGSCRASILQDPPWERSRPTRKSAGRPLDAAPWRHSIACGERTRNGK